MVTILTLDPEDLPANGEILVYNATAKKWLPGPAPAGGGGGVSDHGALTGLTDDDHTQYHNNARGDARYLEPHTFSMRDAIFTLVGGHRIYVDAACTISSVRASVSVAPSGVPILVDVNRNGTTIYGTQANRPSIAVGAFTALGGVASNATLAANDYLTVDVDQVGTPTPGSNLSVTIRLKKV